MLEILRGGGLYLPNAPVIPAEQHPELLHDYNQTRPSKQEERAFY